MSKAIDQILVLLRVMSEELQHVQSISERRNRAVRIVADIYRVDNRTIRDIYIRRLGLRTKRFDHLLDDLFTHGDEEIFQHLREYGDEKDQSSIEKYLEEFNIMPEIKIAPSILSADFARLGEQVAEAGQGGADYIHVDVMDGHFVPNITLGPAIVKAIKPHSTIPLDVHLMIKNPDGFIREFAGAGADIITVHAEAATHVHRTVQSIKESGVKAGVSINPGTPLSMIEEILPYLDLVLIMTVNPGFGGQAFIESMLDKITRLRAMLDDQGLATELEVDGGVNTVVAPKVVEAGARVLVAGAAVYNKNQTVKEAIEGIRASIRG